MARASKRATHARTTSRAPRPQGADAPLLRLARSIAALCDSTTASPLETALEQLAAAYGHGGDVPAALYEAWLQRHRNGRPDKTRALALAWAREQVRLALQELLEAEARRGRVRSDLGAETLAWVLLAGCEALAHEPPGAAPERIRVLLGLAGAR